MNHKDFLHHRHHGFTLVFHKYQQYRKEIESIIAPCGGKMMVNKAVVLSKMLPVVKQFYRFSAQRG